MIRRTLISYVRQQEENADRAGVKFLTCDRPIREGHVRNLQAVHQRQPVRRARCRPLPEVASDAGGARRSARGLARSSPYWDKKDDPALQLRHDMVRAKVSAFMERPDTVYRRYPPSNDSPACALCARDRDLPAWRLALGARQIDGLIQVQPANPYFQELRGQALLEGGKPAEAIGPLRKAVQLSNNAPLIEMLLGQALVATNNNAHTEEAIAILRAAVARETEAPIGYTQLAMAYGRKGDLAQADLASAQAAFLRGDNKTARDLASRAKTRFAVGTPGWVKADDIVSAKPLPGQKDN
jgi:predicted Zn-dependent protease